jgi:hypothetical protein
VSAGEQRPRDPQEQSRDLSEYAHAVSQRSVAILAQVLERRDRLVDSERHLQGQTEQALVTERQKAAWNLSIMQSTATAVASFVAHFEDITATTASAAAIKAAAAAAVGDMGALRRAIKDDHCLSWQKSYPFGRPLTAATANNHIALVYSIVKYFE